MGEPNRRLAVRMLVARLAWLDGVPVWSGGRIAWEEAGGAAAPDPSDLARAQRCLHKIRQYPHAAPLVLGDSYAWLEQRQQCLERVKRLAALREPNIPALIGRAGAGDGDAPARLAALLPAEAVCVNPLPVSPCRALAALGPRAAPLLTALAEDPSALPETRALAALTLGAAHGRTEGGHPPPFTGPTARAYLWGRHRGLPLDPALAAALLAGEEGEALAARCLAAVRPDLPFALTPEGLRRLLHRGIPPARVAALAEAVAAAQPLAARLARYREELPARRAPDRRKVAQALGEQRRGALAVASGLYEEYAMADGDPGLISLLTAFLFSMLDLAPPSEKWTEAVSAMVRDGLALPRGSAAAYLRLLTDRHTRQEGRPPLPTEPREAVKRLIWRAEVQHKWLPERRRDARSLHTLLDRTGDASLAAEALALGVHRILDDYNWADPDKYRWALALLASLPRSTESWEIRRHCDLVDGLGNTEAVRAALHPLMAALQPEPPAVRGLVWDALIDGIGWERSVRRRVLPRMGRYAASLAAFARQTAQPDHLASCLPGLISLDQTQPEAARAWLDLLLADLLAREAQDDARVTEQTIRTASALASALGDGDPDRMMGLFRASLDHALDIEEGRLEQGLSLLGRFPAARSPLAALFPQQPRRCADLLVRLGLTARLGAGALAPLLRLAPLREETSSFPVPLSPDGGWWRLHRLCPELDADAAAYQHACWVRHQAPALPPGVRQALAQPQRWAEELAHLERNAAGRPDLGRRADKLRALFADSERLRADVRALSGERLPRLAAEAQAAALEQQVHACYRARLEELAGPLPAALPLTDDLINVVLLAADLAQNRRLLLRLLRAHLAGETRWREEHPDNIRFLESLTARGADADAWLAARPRRYPCAGAAGGRVHLWLERDPLHVLQMGNYFDTCLSFDAFNAFSTVANACELNKRVVYARDGAGHVVGRKLIGISEAGALVGFRTYTALAGKEENDALRAVFRHYAAAFASDCGLALADAGTVPTLFAEAWYDDGTAAWNEEGAPPGPSP